MLNDTGNNYNNWSWTIKLILLNCGFLSIVDGSTPVPNCTVNPVGYAEWLQKDQEAPPMTYAHMRKPCPIQMPLSGMLHVRRR